MIVHLQKITIRSIFASLIFVAGIQFVGTVHADSFVVTSMSDDGAGSLRVAMVNAQASSNTDDLITFSSSVTGTITLNSALPVIAAASSGGALTITGPGDTLLTINGNQGNFSIFSVASGGNLSVSGLTVSGAKHTDGSGGAFYNLFGTLSISNSTLSNNFSGGGGGAIWSRGPLSVSNSSFANNSAQSSGAISIMGVTTISNSSFTNNFTASGGSGGAILVFPSINGNLPEFSTLRLSNSTFSGNTIDGGQGSAISNAGETIISNTTIFGNTGGEAIANEGTLTVSNCTISGNIQRAINSGFGTGIFNSINGTLVLENTIIANSVDGTDFEGKAPTTNTNNLVETIGLVGGFMGEAASLHPLRQIQN